MSGSKRYDDDDDPYGDNFFVTQSPEPDQVNLDANLLNIFPDADKVLNQNIEENNTTENLAYEEISSALERGEIPKELHFFTGDQSENFQNKLQSLDLNEDNKEFRDFLMSEECKDALECNNIKLSYR